MNDHTFNVHERARKRRQRLPPDEASHDESIAEDNIGEKNDVPLSNAVATLEESSVASSLFSHSDDDQVEGSNLIDEKSRIHKGEHLDTKPPPDVDQDDSSESLFSSSNDSGVQIVATTKPRSSSPPSNFTINKMDASPAVSAITGFQDDSVCSSLFSRDDDSRQETSTDKVNGEEEQVELAAAGPSPKPQEKPVYLTFDRPAYKADVESDIDSSDEGSLFSLNEREGKSPSTQRAQTKLQAAKKVSHLTSFGTPAIPRKKMAALQVQPAELSVPVQKDRYSRLCNKFQRQHSQDSPAEVELKKRAKSRGKVSFSLPVKQKKKLVGKAARALKIAPPHDESLGINAARTTSPKVDITEDGTYFDWQKSYRETLWSREFLKVKKYLREHGNIDIPDGHSLFNWIRKQQKLCQKWVRISNDSIGDGISDEDFQSFVGFQWTSRIEHLVENAILEWTIRLSPMQQKVLRSYRDKSSREHLPSSSTRKNRSVDEHVSDGDEECEFNDSAFARKEERYKETRKKKKRRRDNESRSEKKENNLRSEEKEKEPTCLVDKSFIDERPEKLSWKLSGKSMSTNSGCPSQLQLSPAIQEKLVEIYNTRVESDNTNASRNSQQKLWFDLESVDSKKCSNLGTCEEKTSSASLPKSSSKKTGSKRLWSEVQRLWSDVEQAQRCVAKPPKKVDADSSSSPQNTAVKKKADASKAVDKSKPVEHTKSTAHGSSTEKKPPATISTTASHSMESSEEFPGWLVQCVPRKTKGHDFYYFSPQLKYKLRSRPEVRRFIELVKETGDEAAAMDGFKGKGGKSTPKKNAQQKNAVRGDEAAAVDDSKGKGGKSTPKKNAQQKNAFRDDEADAVDDFKGKGGKSTPKKIAQQKNAVYSKTKTVQKMTVPQHDEAEKMLNEGDKVYAAWDKNKKLKSPVYYSGVVTSAREGSGTSSRVYDIQFDDGDKLCDVEERLVVSKHDYLRNSLKHVYMIGDKVYSAWWPDKKRNKSKPAWYPGTIKGRRVLPRGGQYGPSVLYDILFDDGDEHFNVEDHFVFLHSDYEFTTKQQLSDDKFEWIGVQNVTDKKSIDPWANTVGWYTVVIDGKEQAYPLLTDALRAYDSYTVATLGSKTKQNYLNLPDEWIFSKAGAPTRLHKVTLIAGSKNVYIEKLSTPSNHSKSKQSETSRTVKQQQHVIQYAGNKSNAESALESDHEMDSCDDTHVSSSESFTIKKKPEFEKGEKIYALWSGGTDKWYSGRIWDINILPMSDKGYGPAKTFDVIYDDGETEKGIKEIYVMKKVDYELCITREDKEWIGVRNVTEKDSEDEYAKTVGWYKVHNEETNEEYVFSSLNEALRFHDKNLVKRKAGANISASELNFPSELETRL